MKRTGLLGAVALLIPTVPSTPAIAIPAAWDGGICGPQKGGDACWFQSRGECEYWLAQARRDAGPHDQTLTNRCFEDDFLVELGFEGYEWAFFDSFGAE